MKEFVNYVRMMLKMKNILFLTAVNWNILESINFFHRLASISPSFIHMSRIERLKFILANNEYDLNVICLTYLHDMYTDRTNLLRELCSC